jgi:mannose-6-phosphate isomerase-like protein (cupin superfamily)
MNEKEWTKKLREEGFEDVYVWQDGPDYSYPDHTHPGTSAHIILEGEMTVISEGKTVTHRVGDRFDVPAHTVHSAKIGPQGCKYLVGEM